MDDFPSHVNSIELLRKDAEKLEGQWNGDEAGREEEVANIAKEIQQKCDELTNLLLEL